MAVEIDFERGWSLRADTAAPEAALAVRELEAALGAPGTGGVEVALTHAGDGGDGYMRRAAADRLEIVGDSARGLLFGVYATLEELGARWPWPGEEEPAARRGRIEELDRGGPALPGRCLVLGERALVEDAESWIAWAACNRLNSLFVHVSLARSPAGAAPERTWLDRREAALAEVRQRGMAIEHGGHLLPELLPADDLRALAEGGELGEQARHTLDQHFRTHPEAEVLHLWGADRPPGARGREASVAALRTANALAALAGEAGPGAQVAFLAYHDTEEVPLGVRPRANVCLLFAPRERCYEHPLADPECERNVRYRELLEAHLEHFAEAAPPRVFEYWFDAILFAGGVPDLRETIAADLAFYRDAGVHTVQLLATGHRRPPPPHPNPLAFARLAWNPSAAGGA